LRLQCPLFVGGDWAPVPSAAEGSHRWPAGLALSAAEGAYPKVPHMIRRERDDLSPMARRAISRPVPWRERYRFKPLGYRPPADGRHKVDRYERGERIAGTTMTATLRDPALVREAQDQHPEHHKRQHSI